VVAGWLVQYATWRWIFLVNLPVGITGLLIGLRCLPPIDRQNVAGLDLLGMLLGPLAFATLCYGVSQGSTSWSSAQTLGGLTVGAVALVAFILVELRAQAPLLELRVFRSMHFSLGIVAQWIGQFSLFGTLFLVPLFLEQARGYGAFDARPLVVMGLGLIAGAVALLSHVSTTTQGPDLIGPLAMIGAGMGLMLMTLTTYLLNAAPRKLVGRVTSLTNALQQVSTSLAIAGLATIVTARAVTHGAAAKAVLASLHTRPAGVSSHAAAAHMAHELAVALNAALVTAFADTFHVVIVAAAAGALLALTLRRPRAVPAEAASEPADTGEASAEGMLLAG
jgi:hypothetical protein